MAHIHIGGAGGAPSNNVIRSLRADGSDRLTGQSSVPTDLMLADVDERYVVPPATDPSYEEALMALLARLQPDLLHVQNDFEVRAVSRMRAQIEDLGVSLYLPSGEAVESCVDKHRSYELWQAAGLPVPETLILRSEEDLREALSILGPTVWLRARTGGGGAGAIATDSFEFGKGWIDRHRGWGVFTAAAQLSSRSVTWQSLWSNGALVIAQSRLRRSWAYASRAPSGVTGITAVAETVSDSAIDEIAEAAVRCVDSQPHGLFGVDLTYDAGGHPNLTEINVGRFFTTIHFFTEAGLNMPALYRDLALSRDVEWPNPTVNPLRPGLVWIRGMDVEPLLTTTEALKSSLGEDWT